MNKVAHYTVASAPQLLGDFAPRPVSGHSAPASQLGAQPPEPRFAPSSARTSGSATARGEVCGGKAMRQDETSISPFQVLLK